MIRSSFYPIRYIPENATVCELTDVNAVVCIEEGTDKDGNERLVARGYSGKRNKPDWHHYFKSEEALDTHVAKWVEGIKRSVAFKTEMHEKAKTDRQATKAKATAPTASDAGLDRDTAILRIRNALKRRSGKDWSVTGGKGTAWGWIEINSPPKRQTWQSRQTTTPDSPEPGAWYAGAMGLTPLDRTEAGAKNRIKSPDDDPWAREATEKGRQVLYNWEVDAPGEEYGHMSPDERLELGELLGLGRPVHYQGHSIAASQDYRIEYVQRAEGREVTTFGKQYWD